MKLSTKIIIAAAVAILTTTIGACFTVYWVSSKNRVESLHNDMRVIIKQAETVAVRMDTMHQTKAFDIPGLMAQAKVTCAGRPLKDAYPETVLYNTIPIVAAWQAAGTSAKEQGFAFYTPTATGIAARNPRNEYGDRFADVFKAFAAGQDEYFFQDKAKHLLLFARPVRLAESCLLCHGDPAHSASGDGRDLLGMPMENLKVGDLKGAFVIEAPMTHDPVMAKTMQSMIIVSLALLVIILIGFYYFTHFQINRPLKHAMDQIDSASHQTASAAVQISASSQNLAEGASEQAASLEETGASLEEMSSMTKRNAENVQQVNDLAREASEAANRGAEDVKKMNAAMADIKVSSDGIAKIIKTIDEIAFQTNILALNAAVEAARAGEAGMGFAVVANEVRNLAQLSANAAKETTAKIESALSKTAQGVGITSQVAQALNDILVKTKQVEELAKDVATSASEQTQGIAQINLAVGEMDRVTQANAAAAEECASSAQELNCQAKDMRLSVLVLHRLVEGQGVMTATEAPDPTNAAGKNWDLPASHRRLNNASSINSDRN
jgi:methyl-accepting chemotaxis protein